MSAPRVQCKNCPWKVGSDPYAIRGYELGQHQALSRVIANPGDLAEIVKGDLRMMACHETTERTPSPCVGWVAHQIGPGNNLAMRLACMRGQFDGNVETVGPQHERFEDTLPERPKA